MPTLSSGLVVYTTNDAVFGDYENMSIV